ncbi:DUF1501 domain-containing protein [Gimesia aquarii]|uniref:DUF1501 domain-containing protein n=1 Tax=Gimesia aquarii TaxID=2527964 RepID=A0A517VWX4_9PLAN|nr:DUF1501 domain-containing protein [Gimesia aquarii]QDT97511.1 hypothetical protein V144x_29860 [Gimesia aquarii]
MAISMTCDGVKRRDFLKVGALGFTGLTLSSYLRMVDAGKTKSKGAKSAIFIELPGGPSHMDTFDLKPESPSEYRGEFNPIKTNIDGIEVCEHLPKLASCMDKFALLRGVSHSVAAHALGRSYVNTGNRPLPSLEYPGYGAVFTKENPGPENLPPYVSIPNSTQKPGFLGVKYAPLNTGATPRPGQPFNVRGISLRSGLTVENIERRESLLRDIDQTFNGLEKNSQLIEGLDQFGQQAYSIITSKRARDAFDISKESPAFSKPFGESSFGQSCLLASRLVESGVRFVTVSTGGWDTHRNNWDSLENRLLPSLDTGLSALFNGLAEKGLLESTAVYVTGEFGRTPKINRERGGRDHYPRCMFMLMAGGQVKGGQVIGKSDDKGTGPIDDGYSPDDVAASFYHNLGIDFTQEYHTNTGRPITIVRDGSVIDKLFT